MVDTFSSSRSAFFFFFFLPNYWWVIWDGGSPRASLCPNTHPIVLWHILCLMPVKLLVWFQAWPSQHKVRILSHAISDDCCLLSTEKSLLCHGRIHMCYDKLAIDIWSVRNCCCHNTRQCKEEERKDQSKLVTSVLGPWRLAAKLMAYY